MIRVHNKCRAVPLGYKHDIKYYIITNNLNNCSQISIKHILTFNISTKLNNNIEYYIISLYIFNYYNYIINI